MDPINYDEFVDKLKAEKARPIVIGGKTFQLIPPELMSDEQYKAFTEADDDDLLSIAPLMIDDYDGFKAAGGSAVVLSQILAGIMETEQGATPGEGEAS